MSEKPNAEPAPISMAQKLIMKDMGLDDASIDAIRLNSEAKEVIEYLKAKRTEAAKEQPKTNAKPLAMMTLPESAGAPPPAADAEPKKFNMDLAERMNPLSLKRAYNNRWNPDARILPHITDNGDMEAF